MNASEISLYFQPMTHIEVVSLIYFISIWCGFTLLLGSKSFIKRTNLSQAMDKHRRTWFVNAAMRDLRMIDTGIMSGLQNGAAFFASTSMLAVGGCFAALGSTDQVLVILEDIPLTQDTTRAVFEIKLIGLICILGYGFFKFGWSYRLFNYSAVLLGAIPNRGSVEDDLLMEHADRAAEMNILAGKHFNSGLRSIFLALGYLGSFVAPWALVTTSTIVIAVLIRRQYFSNARDIAILSSQEPIEYKKIASQSDLM